jgi:hypothetical protein
VEESEEDVARDGDGDSDGTRSLLHSDVVSSLSTIVINVARARDERLCLATSSS